jgi:hypothetical protein
MYFKKKGYSGGYENIQHYPVIDQIAKALVGEQQLRPLTPIAVDSSEQAMNSRKRKRLGLMQNLCIQESCGTNNDRGYTKDNARTWCRRSFSITTRTSTTSTISNTI